MEKKKLIIFESVKGAGKSSTIERLAKQIGSVLVLGEDKTLSPIKHNIDKKVDNTHYKKLLDEIESSEIGIFLLDRFHFTKWPVTSFDPNYYEELERLLIDRFDVYLIFLYVSRDILLERLKHTNLQRSDSGWKLNYDGVDVEKESEKDIMWQNLFLEKIIKSTLVQAYTVDTSNMHIGNFEKNVDLVVREVKKIVGFN